MTNLKDIVRRMITDTRYGYIGYHRLSRGLTMYYYPAYLRTSPNVLELGRTDTYPSATEIATIKGYVSEIVDETVTMGRRRQRGGLNTVSLTFHDETEAAEVVEFDLVFN